ncbi:heme exporter protein CcmD [Porticoccaceae bacterium]|nr:heme exporter protein CcmD [Porticoccaceae bacterium]MDB9969468.1 heme exporter protein CcmD [Porticoccaceae bacterium]MDC0011469.1 heme exporter protein CcmD [Porticoccaceae bacterium]MDC1452688.1 heme exporter protein CcmD [Porticoccaceae bacterium]
MYFENIAALINMSGHGVYVWLSVAVTLAAMLWLVIAPLFKQRELLQEVSRDIQRQQDRELAAKTAALSEPHEESN